MDILDNVGKVRETYTENTALDKRKQLTTLGKNNKDGTRKETVLTSQFSSNHYDSSQSPNGPNYVPTVGGGVEEVGAQASQSSSL